MTVINPGGGVSTPAFAFGTLAALPAAAAGNAKTGYVTTDTGEVFFSDGATWRSILKLAGATLALAPASNLITASGQQISLGGTYIAASGSTLVTAAGLQASNNGPGNGLLVKEGANAKQGTATLVAGTVTVANTVVTANSRIVLTPQDNNTTGAVRVSARVAGSSFTITSSNAGDTGVIAYEIFEPGV